MKLIIPNLVVAQNITSAHRRISSLSESTPMKPLRGVGSMSAFALDTVVTMFTTHFA